MTCFGQIGFSDYTHIADLEEDAFWHATLPDIWTVWGDTCEFSASSVPWRLDSWGWLGQPGVKMLPCRPCRQASSPGGRWQCNRRFPRSGATPSPAASASATASPAPAQAPPASAGSPASTVAGPLQVPAPATVIPPAAGLPASDLLPPGLGTSPLPRRWPAPRRTPGRTRTHPCSVRGLHPRRGS